MKVVLAGAFGNLGAEILKCLCAAGHEVIAADLYGNRSEDDYKYYKAMDKQPDARYMKLRLVRRYEEGDLPLQELKTNGLTSVQGRSKVTQQLLKYINSK